MNIIFLSSNKNKIREAKEILGEKGINIIECNEKIEELQTVDTLKLVRDKTLKAFSIIGHPLFVEHTGLYLEVMNGFPGGLTQIFWDSLKAEKFADFFGKEGTDKVKAKTIIGYCDGKNIHIFSGEIEGHISNKPRGDCSFQWDCVFIPEGYGLTFAELGDVKNNISMRKMALNDFAEFLEAKNG